ncbi:MAG: hypothetical protein K2W96_26570, partial [Gemmataceae bacterium]|nr:hypothetical protein [Gemmataceae bacterium]
AGSAIAGGGGEGGSSSLNNGAPTMIGDLGSRGVGLSDRFVSGGVVLNRRVRPLVNAGAFKIAENESPRPIDRVFLTYNYFDDVNTFGSRRGDLDVHRQVIGFERTFLDGDASFGARLPFLQANGGGIDGVGDLTLVSKFAFVNNRRTGDIVSGGLVLTLPTGRDVRLVDGSNLQSLLFQPWVGGILNSDDFYVHGFSSLIIPTESRDATLWSNDIGVGYRLYQDRNAALSAIIPTLEAHLLTPLSKRGADRVLNGTALVGVPDQLILTAGVHFGLYDRAFLTLGAATPVTGPRLFNVEGIVQLNVAF